MEIDRIKEIKTLFLQGKITLSEAKELAKPVIDSMNTKAEKIAAQFGKKHRPFRFTSLFR